MSDARVHFEKTGPASEHALYQLVENAPLKLPSDYIAFLRQCNGCEGELGIDPGWVWIWPAEEVIEHNNGYKTAENVSGFFAFGSNGGGEMFAFDFRTPDETRVVMIPFIPMEIKSAIPLAASFGEFSEHFGLRTD
jgi:hypothetical protein